MKAILMVIRPEWFIKILTGEKTWEIRGNNTRIRGKIELIQSGSGLIMGCCEIVDSLEIDKKFFLNWENKHCIKSIDDIHYKKIYAWVIKNPIRYPTPKPYKHPWGAETWVNL